MYNIMSAAVPALGVMGLKAYGGGKGRPKFHIQLSSTETGELLAIIEAGRLGQLRTGAASGVATKYMARDNASTVGVIGTGNQAETQLEAVCHVHEFTSINVFSRTVERRESFATSMSAKLGVPVSPVESAEKCVADSDVLLVITSASEPVLDGHWINPGTHINAAGANSSNRRELDDEAVRRASVVIVDDIDQARIECGDIIHAVDNGFVRWEQVRSLADVVGGTAPGRKSEEDITLFESLGVALEDIALGARVYELAMEQGAGVPF
jgi:ornithine cyclodeaminase/alanine dehydrogenase-like protein (mu-crystallin family)